MVRIFTHQRQVMTDHEYGHMPPAPDFIDRIQEQSLSVLVHPGYRLIQDQKIRFRVQGKRQKHALDLAARAPAQGPFHKVLGVGSDLVSMLVFGIVWAVLISVIKHTGTSSADTVISVFSSTSVALGLLILSRGGGFARYSSLLIGDVLAVTPMDLLYLLLALLGGIALWMVLYNGLLLTSVSQSLAASRGVKTRLYEICYAALVAVAVMLAIRWVGVMLINALLIIPAAAARNLARSARSHALISVLLALVSGIAGLISAYSWNTSAGAAIVLYASLFYALSMLLRGKVRG